MEKMPEKPVTPEEAKPLFDAMRAVVEDTETSPKKEKPKIEPTKDFKTGSGAMAKWQEEHDDMEDRRNHKAA